MAVVAIIGLMLGVMLPNLTATRGSELKRQAQDLASYLELARERAIVTSSPHRVWIEMEEGAFRVDWWVSEEKAFGELEEGENLNSQASIQTDRYSLTPPAAEYRDYFPIPSRFGREQWLEDDTFFEGINTETGWVTEGEVQLVFQTDGSTDYAELTLTDDWGNQVILEVQPLLDYVRVHRVEED